jgi:hypothetical protein
MYMYLFVNNLLSPCILLHQSICHGCPLAPYLYILIVDALGYQLDVACIQGLVCSILFPNWSKMVKNYFVDDSLHFVQVD